MLATIALITVGTQTLVAPKSHSHEGHVHHESCAHGSHDWRAHLPVEVQAKANRAYVFAGQWPQDQDKKQDQGAGQDGQDKGQETKTEPLTEEEKAAERFQAEVQKDIERGREISAEIDKELTLSTNEEMNARLQAIALEMTEIANAQEYTVLWGDKRYAKLPYEFKLVQGKDVNAFSLPGGVIYFYEGLMDFAESDDEIAAVVAHEISHAAFRHMATMEKNYNQVQLYNIPILIAAALSRDSNAMNALIASQLASQGLVSSWSVEAETSADYGSIQMMSDSRYNAVGMLTFMERLAFRDKFTPNIDWGIYRTHPPSQTRADFIKRSLKEYNIPIKRSAVTTTFSSRSVPIEDTHFELWFGEEKIHDFRGVDAKTRAARAAVRLNNFLDGVPEMFQVSASGASVMGKNRELFKITSDDLLRGQEARTVAKDAVVSLKRVVFDISFRLQPIGNPK